MGNDKDNLASFAAFDAFPDAVVVFDRSFSIETWNAGAERLFGIPRIEALQQSLKTILPLEIKQVFVDACERRSSWRGDAPYSKNDGETVWIHWTVSVFSPDVDGNSRFLATGADVSERKHAERVLEIQREFFKELARTEDLDAILRLCLRRAMRISEMECGGIYMLDPVTGAADLFDHKGLSERFCQAVGHFEKGSKGIQTILEKKPIYYNAKRLEEESSEHLREEGLQSLAVIPIVCDDQVFGSIHVASYKTMTLSASARNGLEAITCQTGLLIAKHRFFKKMFDSDKRFQQLYESMIEGMALHELVYDEEGKPVDYVLVEVNPAFETILGMSRQKVIGRKASEIYASDPPQFFDIYRKVAETGESTRFEVQYPPLAKYFRIQVFSYAKGMFATLFEDITEMKVAEKSLREREETYRALADHSPDIIARFDREHRCLYINNAIEAVGSRKMEEYLGKTQRELGFPEPVIQRWDHALDTVFARSEPFDMEFEWPDGACFDARLVPEFDEAGEVKVVLASIRDITEKKRSVEERVRLERQLRQAQKMESIGRLASGVAHDFNNLLTGITGNVELAMMEEDIAPPLMTALEEVRSEAKSAGKLVRQLLTFTSKQENKPSIFSLNELLKGMVSMLKPLLGEDVAFDMILSEGMEYVEADANQIEQVVMNLVVNSRDAMTMGGEIRIETSKIELDASFCEERFDLKPGTYVKLVVSDTGTGIPREVLPQIFEPFFTTKRKGEGTGLGLSIVFGIVRQNRGFIDVDSEIDQGTTFTIYLPNVRPPSQRPVPVKTSRKPLPEGNETIFLVEDEQLVRDVTSQILSRIGYRVHAFEDGPSALAAIRAFGEPIDLLLTDVIMPGMNGRQLAEKVKVLRPDIKILFNSGYMENIIADHGVLDHGVQFISKPFTPLSLAQKIREVLEAKPS